VQRRTDHGRALRYRRTIESTGTRAMTLRSLIVPLLAAAVLASGCAGPDPRYAGDDYRYGSAGGNEGYYGVIDAIENAPGSQRGNVLAGTVIGGVIGGVLGHQVGSGRGNDVATVAGAVGGAVVGHEIGRANGEQDAYVIRVRFDDRSYRTVTQDTLEGLRVGDCVRFERGRVRRY
jgi:outer membrane lipoprotein SlyB